jgi:hypothetical protein
MSGRGIGATVQYIKYITIIDISHKQHQQQQQEHTVDPVYSERVGAAKSVHNNGYSL